MKRTTNRRVVQRESNDRARDRYTTLDKVVRDNQAQRTIYITKQITLYAYLTFPPQNWQCAPCHPSRHTQVPLTQSPFRQLSASQPVSVLGDDEEVEAAALTCTTQQQTRAAHSNGHGTATAPCHHRRRCRQSRRTATSSRRNSRHWPFRRYLDLYRNKNICTTSAILVGFHVRDNGRRRRTEQGRAYGVPRSVNADVDDAAVTVATVDVVVAVAVVVVVVV